MSPDDPRFERFVVAGMWPFLRSSFLGQQDLEDMAQDVRLVLWQYEGPYRSTVARRAAIDWWRDYWGRARKDGSNRVRHGQLMHWALREMTIESHQGHVRIADGPHRATDREEVWCAAAGLTTDGVDDEAAEDLARAVAAVLERLPARHALILRRVYLEHVQQSDVAVELGIHPSRVCQLAKKARLAFARQWTLAQAREAA